MTIEDPEVEKLLGRRARELMRRPVAREEKGRYSPLNLSEWNFDGIVRSKPFALVDFWAEWCGSW